jgi:glycosyltransferase involved in cell wall biosynthesis
MNTVCFASLEGFDGCLTACRNAAAVLGATWATISRRDAPPPSVLECDLLVLSSWHARYEPILEGRYGPTAARWHSTVLQSELCEEAPKVARVVELADRGSLTALVVSDPEFVGVLARDSVVFMPEVLADGEYRRVTPARLASVNVSLFGAGHPRKNLFVQSAAFERARRAQGAAPWTLHLNGATIDDSRYDEWLRAARIPFVDHGWLERSDYLSLVAAMDAGLAATLCEGYCYVAADHVALGVPIVASPDIRCLGGDFAGTRPDRVHDVAASLSFTLANRQAVALPQRQGLEKQARVNAAIARRALFELLERSRSFARR